MGPAPAPWAGTSAGPIPARPAEPRQAGWPPAGAAPSSGYAPAGGVSPQMPAPVSAPVALYGGPAAAGTVPMGPVGQPYAPQQPMQPTPPTGPSWHQPPANPPPVPPPGAGGMPPEPLTPQAVGWAPQARPVPVGMPISTGVNGQLTPLTTKTSTSRTRRGASGQRASMMALTFLCVAGVFLLGVLLVLVYTLSR